MYSSSDGKSNAGCFVLFLVFLLMYFNNYKHINYPGKLKTNSTLTFFLNEAEVENCMKHFHFEHQGNISEVKDGEVLSLVQVVKMEQERSTINENKHF